MSHPESTYPKETSSDSTVVETGGKSKKGRKEKEKLSHVRFVNLEEEISIAHAKRNLCSVSILKPVIYVERAVEKSPEDEQNDGDFTCSEADDNSDDDNSHYVSKRRGKRNLDGSNKPTREAFYHINAAFSLEVEIVNFDKEYVASWLCKELLE